MISAGEPLLPLSPGRRRCHLRPGRSAVRSGSSVPASVAHVLPARAVLLHICSRDETASLCLLWGDGRGCFSALLERLRSITVYPLTIRISASIACGVCRRSTCCNLYSTASQCLLPMLASRRDVARAWPGRCILYLPDRCAIQDSSSLRRASLSEAWADLGRPSASFALRKALVSDFVPRHDAKCSFHVRASAGLDAVQSGRFCNLRAPSEARPLHARHRHAFEDPMRYSRANASGAVPCQRRCCKMKAGGTHSGFDRTSKAG